MADPDPWLTQFEARMAEREQEDRSFLLLGERLVYRASVAPEVGIRLGEFQRASIAYARDVQARKDAGEPSPEATITDQEMLELGEWIIRSCLEPGSVEAWERIRSPDAARQLTLIDIYELAMYVQAKAAGTLPTVAPIGSPDGRRIGEPSSKGASRSPAIKPRAARTPRRSRST